MIETAGYTKHVGKVLQKLLVLRQVATGDLPRNFDIAPRRQGGQQIELLKHEANLRLTQHGALRIGQPGKIHAIDQNASRSRPREPAKDVEERRFSAARGADNADEFTRRHNERDVAKSGDVYLPRSINLADVLCLNDGLHVTDCNWQVLDMRDTGR